MEPPPGEPPSPGPVGRGEATFYLVTRYPGRTALIVLVAIVAAVVLVVRGGGADANAAVEHYVVARGLEQSVSVHCTRTDGTERGHSLYSCSITSGGVELAGGPTLAECYVVDGDDASPSLVDRC